MHPREATSSQATVLTLPGRDIVLAPTGSGLDEQTAAAFTVLQSLTSAQRAALVSAWTPKMGRDAATMQHLKEMVTGEVQSRSADSAAPQRASRPRRGAAGTDKPSKKPKPWSVTGTPRESYVEMLQMVFASRMLFQLAEALDGLQKPAGRPGRTSPYPASVLLAVMVLARVYGSLPRALAVLQHEDHWSLVRDLVERATTPIGGGPGLVLPHRAPTINTMRVFRRMLDGSLEHREALQQRFQRISYALARRLGNFAALAPDFTAPDTRHAIYGDGTILRPYSSVRVIPTLDGTAIPVGSKAKHRPRVPVALTDTGADDKKDIGLNMVSLHTLTEHGRVVLATGTAFGAEMWTSLDLIDSVMAHVEDLEARTPNSAAEDGGSPVHTLVYDRAITGWSVDYLMHRYGIQTLTKSSAASNKGEHALTDEEIKTRTDDYAIYAGADILGRETRAAIMPYLRYEVLSQVIRSYDAMPVGLSYYPSESDKKEVFRTHTKDLPDATHHSPDGPCRHSVVMDDGSLFLVATDPELGHRTKTWLLECDTATRHRRPDGGWTRRCTYTVPCVYGDFTYEHEWEASEPRRQPGHDRDLADPVGWRLRPLGRADDLVDWYNHGADADEITPEQRRFTRAYSVRNDAESYNQWFQQSLLHHGRAANETLPGQELDWLCGAILNNILTHGRYLSALS